MKIIPISILIIALMACQEQSLKTIDYNPSTYIDQNWAMDKLWEDGQAEVALYDAEMIIYGQARNFEQALITVKEEFNKAYNVKTDDYSRTDLFPVMKVNRFADIPTPNYPYHYLTSLFFKRDQPEQLHKMTHTGQEWCGNTFKQFEVIPSGYAYDYNSYFDGYGDGTMEIEGNDFWWEDQLPYVLRALQFEDGLRFEKEVLNSQINTKTYRPKLERVKFMVIDLDSLWQVQADFSNGINTYQFQKNYPNVLVMQETKEGHNLRLKTISRYKYWR